MLKFRVFLLLLILVFLTAAVIASDANNVYPIIKTSISALVSGEAVSVSSLKLSLKNAIENSVVLEPGSSLVIDRATGLLFEDVHAKQLAIPIKVFKGGLMQKELSLEVDVVMNPIDLTKPTDVIMISNSPEEVVHPGMLMSSFIEDESVAKLIVYHKNTAGYTQDLVLTVTNMENIPVLLHVTSGHGGPNVDGLFAGHQATRRFYEELSVGSGSFITIPAHSSRVIQQVGIKDNQVVAGVYRLTRMSKGKLRVSTMMMDEKTEGLVAYLNHAEENRGHVGGMFSGGYEHIKKKYIIGDDIVNIRLGGEPYLRDTKTGNFLRGNYGLSYHIDIDVVNDKSERRAVNLLFAPSGGIARGVFLMDGEIIETGLLNPDTENSMARICRVEIEPKRMMNIKFVYYATTWVFLSSEYYSGD